MGFTQFNTNPHEHFDFAYEKGRIAALSQKTWLKSFRGEREQGESSLIRCVGDVPFSDAELKIIERILGEFPSLASRHTLLFIFKSKILSDFQQATYDGETKTIILRGDLDALGPDTYLALIIHEVIHALIASDPVFFAHTTSDLGWRTEGHDYFFSAYGTHFKISDADIAFGTLPDVPLDARMFPSTYSLFGPDEMLAELATVQILENFSATKVSRFDFAAYKESPYRPLVNQFLDRMR